MYSALVVGGTWDVVIKKYWLINLIVRKWPHYPCTEFTNLGDINKSTCIVLRLTTRVEAIANPIPLVWGVGVNFVKAVGRRLDSHIQF